MRTLWSLGSYDRISRFKLCGESLVKSLLVIGLVDVHDALIKSNSIAAVQRLNVVIRDELDIELAVMISLSFETMNDSSVRCVSDDLTIVGVYKINDDFRPATFASNVISANLQDSQSSTPVNRGERDSIASCALSQGESDMTIVQADERFIL